MSESNASIKSSQAGNFLIWDSEGVPPSLGCSLILWQAFNSEASSEHLSIPELVEENADRLKERYLSWVHELGETVNDEKSLVGDLELRPGFSYWWMSLITEKCNFAKSPLITDAIRLFALDDWSKQFPVIESVKLVSANDALHQCLEKWCKTKEICFESQRLPIKRAERKTVISQIFNKLPNTIQAGTWLLRYLIDRWSLRGVGVEEWKKAKTQVTFVSYLFNLQTSAARAGRFESEYWTRLPYALDEENICSSWMHLYVKSPTVPTAESAAKLLRSFNTNGNGEQVHVALDSFLSIKTVVRTILDYLRVRRMSPKDYAKILECKKKELQLMERAIWPLFRRDWERSFFGVEAIQNSLTLNLFEKAFADLPKQSIGVYLQENQGWELGMIHSWRDNAHGELIGFPHATVRFWDLRYFFDQRSYCRSQLLYRCLILSQQVENLLKAYISKAVTQQKISLS